VAQAGGQRRSPSGIEKNDSEAYSNDRRVHYVHRGLEHRAVGRAMRKAEESVMYRWVNRKKCRYYTARISQDLLGQWMLVLAWGDIESCRGAIRKIVLASEDEGQRKIVAIAKRREAHGYEFARSESP
jgi:hypothetical protein